MWRLRMIPSQARLRWMVRRLLARRSVNLREVAVEERTLAPVERARIPAAIHLDGAMDRVRGLSPWRNWETERLLVGGGEIEHAPTVAHLVRNAEIDGPFVYCGAAKADLGWDGDPAAASGGYERIDEADLVSSWGASRFFGHFLWDSLPLELLPGEGARTVALRTKPYHHEQGYRELLACPAPLTVDRGRIQRMTFFSDFGQNSLKAARYRTLRERMSAAVGHGTGGAGVYLRRGATGERRILANEEEVERRLADLGFAIVDSAGQPAAEIARQTAGARIVVSIEGSHISHALYTIADDGVFLVLQPPDRFAMPYKEFADCLGLGFAFLVGLPADDGFTVPPDEIDRLLERIQ